MVWVSEYCQCELCRWHISTYVVLDCNAFTTF
jgi:hypothetical protein